MTERKSIRQILNRPLTDMDEALRKALEEASKALAKESGQ